MRVAPGSVSGGHTALIERASFSPDGERFVAGDLNGGLIVRTRSGEITAKLRVPPAGQYSKPQVRAVAWSPDGSRIAVHEYGGVRLRRPADLAEEAEAKSVGDGPLAFGGGGRWLALLSGASLYVRGVPAFDNLGFHMLSRGSFEYFSADRLAADPHGSLIAAGDDGGCDETAMGARTARGEPQVTLIDADRGAQIGAIERGHPIFGLEFDPWRGRLLTVLHLDVGVWSRTGEAIARFAPYPNSYARSLAVSERWIATVPSTGERARIDFFDPDTYERLATVELPGPIAPSWIAASADGSAFVTPELPLNRDFAVRIWTVEYGRAIGRDEVHVVPMIGAYDRGRDYYDQDDYDAAIASFSEALRDDPQSAKAFLARGNAWLAKGDCDHAIADYDQALRIDPRYALAYQNRGGAWYDKRDYDRAIADYKQALGLSHVSANTYLGLGRAYAAKRNYDGALQCYGLALSLDPKDADIHIDRGNAFAGKGDYERAIASYDDALRLDPENATSYHRRAVARHNQGDYDRAIADFSEVLRLNPQNANALYNRGVAWHCKDERGHALIDFEKALHVDPRHVSAHNGAALLLASAPDAAIRNGERAVDLARKAAELTGWNASHILSTLAAAHAEAGNFTEAIRWQEKALAFPEFAASRGEEARQRLDLYRRGQPYREPTSG